MGSQDELEETLAVLQELNDNEPLVTSSSRQLSDKESGFENTFALASGSEDD